MNQQHRFGFTLVEVMTVLAILSILIAMGLPAVQFARETSRKNTCCNHARQIGLAAQIHQTAHQSLPSNGGFTEAHVYVNESARGFTAKPPVLLLQFFGSFHPRSYPLVR